ncbi:MAG: c-type cytochrome domain-containing protein [Gemmataceae bacterium]
MIAYRWIVVALLGVMAATASAQAPTAPDPPPPGPVSYYREVRRIFQQNCQGCHQPARAMGGYVMTDFANLLKAGDTGNPAVVPGHPEKSELINQIRVEGGKALMPKNKQPLKPHEFALIERWIREGAKDDTPKLAQDTISDKNPPVYKQPPLITALDFSPDGQLLAVSGFHEVLLHKADGSGLVGRLIGLSERVQSLAFSPDGKSLAVAGGSPGRFGEVQVWDVQRRKLRFSVSVTYDTLYGVSWSPDGTKIAFGCADNSLRAIDSSTGKQVLFQGAHSDWVLGTVFSRDSAHLISTSRDMSMKLTEVATQRFVDNITSITPGRLKGGLQTVDLRPGQPETKVKGVDGADKIYDEVVVGGSDGTPRLYKIHRVKQRTIGDDDNKVRDYAPMPGRINAVRFNKTGTLFAAGSSSDGTGELRLYNVADGKIVAKLENTTPIFALAFHPEGKTVAIAGFDGVIRLVDATTGKISKEFLSVEKAK